MCSEACAALSSAHTVLRFTFHATYASGDGFMWRYVLVRLESTQRGDPAMPSIAMGHAAPPSQHDGAARPVKAAVAVVPDYFDSEEQRARYMYGQQSASSDLNIRVVTPESAPQASWYPGAQPQQAEGAAATEPMYDRKVGSHV